ncbi:MAG: hypothetical protein ACE5KZ_02310 [Candidatus Scalinduaceae bacterium]
MRKIISIFFIFSLLPSLSRAVELKNTSFFMKSVGQADYIEGEMLVKYRKEVSLERIEAINSQFGVEVIKVMPRIDVYHVKIPPDTTVIDMVEKYSNIPEVEFAEPNYQMRID